MEELEKEYRRALKSFLYFDRKFQSVKKIETKEKYLRFMQINQKYRESILSKMGGKNERKNFENKN